MTKFTKKDKYAALIDAFELIDADQINNIAVDDLIAFCKNEIGKIDAANEKKKAKNAETIDALIDVIVGAMSTDDFMSGREIVDAIGDEEVTQSKITYRLNKLVDAGKVEKTLIKGDGKQVTAYKLI